MGETGEKTDYFSVRDGVECAGLHLLVDMWGAKFPASTEGQYAVDIDELALILKLAARAAGATILDSAFHRFESEGFLSPVSGVILLAESHISIHTWPERDFTAVDIFMCGSCNPHKVLPVLERNFKPSRVQVKISYRGALPAFP